MPAILTSNRSRPLHRGVVSRPAVASYSSALAERSRARRERPRPWAQTSLGTSRSHASSTAATTSQTSTQGSHMSFIPPPPQRTVAGPPSSTSSLARNTHSFIPVAKFSDVQVTTRLTGQGSPASTVFTSSTQPSPLEPSFAAPRHSTKTVQSAKAATPSATALTSTCSSAHTVSSESTTCSSANTVSTGSQESRTSRIPRINKAFQDARRILDSRCPSAAHTLSSASSGIRTEASTVTTSSLARSLESLSLAQTVRPTGTRPTPSTQSLRPTGTRPPPSTQSLSSSQVPVRARAVRAAVELGRASVVDNRKRGKFLHPTLHSS